MKLPDFLTDTNRAPHSWNLIFALAKLNKMNKISQSSLFSFHFKDYHTYMYVTGNQNFVPIHSVDVEIFHSIS